MKTTLLMLAAAAAVVAALSAAAPAAAATTCSYSGTTHNATITVTGNNSSVVIVRSATAISVDGVPCGGATVSNTAKVIVNGANGRQDVNIDFSGGAFAPGAGADTGAAEIEFQVNLAGGTDSLRLLGSAGVDNWRIGADGINFNGDGDADITMPGVEELRTDGNASGDVISGTGGLGTGAAYQARIAMYGGIGQDTLTGGDGPDYLSGENQSDTMSGGAGADYLYGDAGADTLDGGADPDYVYGGTENDTVKGGPGNDNMYALSTPDGTDVFMGEAGSDYVSYYQRSASVTLTIDGVANDGAAGENDNIKLDVERLQGSSANDTITGSAANNTLDGYLGADTVNGGPGDDNLYGGCCDTAADILHGGDDYDQLYGYDGPDELYGENGNDSLYGNGGNDLVDGGAGNDSLSAEYNGLDGSDDMHGGAGIDSANYYRPAGNQTFSMGNNQADDGLAGEHDNVHSDIEILYGGDGADVISGTPSANTIYGYAGNDTIDGKDGADYLEGDNGNDTLIGGDGEDYLYGYDDNDSFKLLDGGYDYADGGNGTDSVTTKDAFDFVTGVP